MQTLLIKLDEPMVKPILDFLSKYPVSNYKVKNIEFDINDDIELLEDKIAYLQADYDLKNGESIKLDDYMKNRGIN